jgi:pyroglutamyl-peptidase
MSRPALVTGFMPYAGRGRNPSSEITKALDGKIIHGTPVVGRLLPVSLADIVTLASKLLQELNPRVVVSLGLWPGEPVVRIERVGLNIADFEIPDNLGRMATDEPILGNAFAAKFSTLPVRKIETALLEAGIPARISNTAGTYLCNACLYSFLSAAETMRESLACGFIHIPYLPNQVAELQQSLKEEGRLEAHQRSDMASMDLATSTRAVEIAIKTAIQDSP